MKVKSGEKFGCQASLSRLYLLTVTERAPSASSLTVPIAAMALELLATELAEKIGRMLDETDLLTIARLNHRWSELARYQLTRRYWTNLHLKSYEKIAAFSQLCASPFSTLDRQVYQNLTIDTSSPPHRTMFMGTNLFAFLHTTTFLESVTIDLRSITMASKPSPFPWMVLTSWTAMTGVSIAATLPSLSILASVILALPNLRGLVLDVDYIDSSLPNIHLGSSPRYLDSFHLGERGHAVLSWLAGFSPSDLSIRDFSLKIEDEDLNPLQTFAGCHGSEMEYLSFTLYRDRSSELASCLSLLTGMVVGELYLKFRPQQGYVACVESCASAVDAPWIESLSVYVPFLSGGSEELQSLQEIARARFSLKCFLHEEGFDVVTVSQRSWM
ncbi:hypothetical protein D9611_013507 [Ephemerocybe angulata]|uniref:F-box domain-containing protein n=1 Tax=Ephemerocybe angulata TaxID=980116 RepID=A0A8H5BTE4_9AGAR|nr:hypothetical protein D9611_013507 [Tulosesus angulatus]